MVSETRAGGRGSQMPLRGPPSRGARLAALGGRIPRGSAGRRHPLRSALSRLRLAYRVPR
eukprot:2128663-Pyramimonas_sp.AAC.1